MKISDAFPSRYLRAADIPAAQFVPYTIADVTVETVGDDESESKPVVHFVNVAKGLVLNRVNSNVISEHFSDETANWKGKTILLYATDVQFQGRLVPAIRVRVAAPGAVPAAPAAAPVAQSKVTADQITALVADWRKAHPDVADDREAFLGWVRATLQVTLPMTSLTDWTIPRLELCRAALVPAEAGGMLIPF
jgi:hypothetical protein